jgi:serine/threonine-protein kinase
VAVDVGGGGRVTLDVWIDDWIRDTLTPLTSGGTGNAKPVWTPDGRRIVFSSNRSSDSVNLFWQRADGSGDVQRLTESKNNQLAGSWHPNGKLLAFTEQNAASNGDLMILSMDGDESSGWKPGTSKPFLNTSFNEQEPMFSPDGRWLAYFSNESGSSEVYVRPFPGPGGRWPISTGGGAYPRWSKNGRELFYRTPSEGNEQIMVVTYTAEGDVFRADKPRLWSSTAIGIRPRLGNFDLHPDGERVAVAPVSDPRLFAKQDKVVIIFNFFDDLRRLAPVAKR